MHKVLKEFLSYFVFGLFLMLEFMLVFGLLLAALVVPYYIAIYEIGAMPGSTETAWALFIGVLLMGGWSAFLILGGRRKIRQTFEQLTQWVLKSLRIQ